MPPRLSLLVRNSKAAKPRQTPIPSFLLPFLHARQQHRNASILSSLSNVTSSYGHRKRVGRGPSSGKGKTAGKGMNGQKKRGTVPFIHSLGRPFNGGQTPNEIVHGKRGFHNPFSVSLQTVNLSKLTSWIVQNRIDPTRPITVRELHQSRCIASPKDGVKLLATGKETLPPNTPLQIIASRASAAAIAAVEAAGGKVSTRYYTPFALRQIVRGRMDPVHSLQSNFNEEEWGERQAIGYRLPDPTSRKDMEYYRDPAKRGYLSHLVPEGEGPSLFYKTPGVKKRGAVLRKKRVDKGMESNRIW